jgi:polysaccharide biosynthesis/export protein
VATKLENRWGFLVGLVLPVLLDGCAFTPGLQVDAGPQGFFRGTPTEPEEEENYVLIPVNAKLVASMETEAQPEGRQLPPEWVNEPDPYEYRVGPNDLLQVMVWDHPELSLQGTSDNSSPGAGPAASANPGLGIRVNPQGNLFFPFVGSVHVAGKSADEIRETVKAGLARYVQDPQVDVRVIGFRSKKVHVAGEVRQPRDVPITDVPLRLLDAINAAGGTEQSGNVGSGFYAAAGAGTTLKPDLDDVRVIRNGKQISVSLLDIYDRGRVDENILLQDGDMVHVPNLDAKKIYVMGEVKAAGLQAYERGRLNLAAALQRAGGISQESAEGTRVLVMRRGKTKPLAYYLNLNEADTLVLSTRFPLKPSDIVYVGTADIIKFERVVQAFMPIINTAILGGAIAAR